MKKSQDIKKFKIGKTLGLPTFFEFSFAMLAQMELSESENSQLEREKAR
jgi:hypothetical protein